jgi:hypothetical protein
VFPFVVFFFTLRKSKIKKTKKSSNQQNAQSLFNPNKNISLLFIVLYHFNPQEEKVQGQQLNKPSKKLLFEQYASIF